MRTDRTSDIDPVIAEICRRNSVSDILTSRGVELSKAGKRMKCRCPLPGHKKDNTPSFNIGRFDDGTEFFKCFGCGASGSAIKLIALLDNISNGEVVKRLAKASNIKLKNMEGIVKVDPLADDILQVLCSYAYEGLFKDICLHLERFIWKHRGDTDMVNKGMRVYMKAKQLSNIGDEEALMHLKADVYDLEAEGYNSGMENTEDED